MRKRGHFEDKGPMSFMHLRIYGSISVCGKQGVHTTKRLCMVTCDLCKEIRSKQSQGE